MSKWKSLSIDNVHELDAPVSYILVACSIIVSIMSFAKVPYADVSMRYFQPDNIWGISISILASIREYR